MWMIANVTNLKKIEIRLVLHELLQFYSQMLWTNECNNKRNMFQLPDIPQKWYCIWNEDMDINFPMNYINDFLGSISKRTVSSVILFIFGRPCIKTSMKVQKWNKKETRKFRQTYQDNNAV